MSNSIIGRELRAKTREQRMPQIYCCETYFCLKFRMVWRSVPVRKCRYCFWSFAWSGNLNKLKGKTNDFWTCWGWTCPRALWQLCLGRTFEYPKLSSVQTTIVIQSLIIKTTSQNRAGSMRRKKNFKFWPVPFGSTGRLQSSWLRSHTIMNPKCFPMKLVTMSRWHKVHQCLDQRN